MRTAALQQAVQQRVRAVSVRDRPDGVIYEKAYTLLLLLLALLAWFLVSE
ncbi:hypothetical protein EI42_05440 [Thermosporothrix hazakensis]|uniref:Uncharacterized protein n=1 Tax=Thermosporothrix hazakensis TaxID=644383 RepID=A0A326U084_THEHA|nr:hypothetical protein EI42_05440 [Thermosporothrix hazakensis]